MEKYKSHDKDLTQNNLQNAKIKLQQFNFGAVSKQGDNFG